MKLQHLLSVACAALALGLIGCDKKKEPVTGAPKTPGSETLKGASDAAKDAANKAGETIDKAAKEAKDKVVSTAQGLYDSAKKEFDALAAKVSGSSSPEKPIWQKAVDGIKTQFSQADTKMSDLKADNSDWKKIGDELNALMGKISEGVKSLAGQVK